MLGYVLSRAASRDFETLTIKNWRGDDAETGEDLAEKIREYHISDFSNWKNHDGFESTFTDLLRDLRAQA